MRIETLSSTQRVLLLYVAPPLYLCWRVYWSNRMPIMDCDEVYNYWEPLHFVLFGGDSGGQQTWEYANEYALRTYAYIYPLKWISQSLIQPLLVPVRMTPSSSSSTSSLFFFLTGETTTTMLSLDDKRFQFVCLRACLGLGMGTCELIWLGTIGCKISVRHAFWTGLLLLTGAGMNHAAAAYLPSATWIMVWLLANSLFWQEWHYTFCVVAVQAALSIGWPFGVVLLVPMGCVILWDRWRINGTSLMRLLLWTALVTLVVQTAVLWLDSKEYGRWTSATFNILKYNAAGGGDELYGVEPVSYYVKNLLLNWNLVAPLGLLVLPLVLFSQHERELHHWPTLLVGTFLPMYVWLALTLPRPHKEERFLFPIYPLLCLGAVWTVDTTINAIGRVAASLSRHKEVSPRLRFGLHSFVWIGAVLVSLSRTVALSKYYFAPLRIYSQLAMAVAAQQQQQQSGPSKNDSHNNKDDEQLVCTCGEWYRFPSSFFLPGKNLHLAFLESSFQGQLPQRFSEYGSRPESRLVLQPFNDRNLKQPERYVQPHQCDWIIDLEGSECFHDFGEAEEESTMEVVARAPFLNAEETEALHRILYIPFLHERAQRSGQVKYHNYILARPSRLSV